MAAFDFLPHSGRDDFLAFGKITNAVQVRAISDNYAAAADRVFRAARPVIETSRAYADYKQPSLAIATVTP
jgi:hypothetical protein